MTQQPTYSVSELNRSIRSMLESRFPFIRVKGEISNLSRPYSGHIYFVLKDENSQLKAILFKMQQRYLDKQPEDGQEVVCQGRISLYEARGDYQLIVDTIDFQGEGNLLLIFERLKRKLEAEGLFAAEKKKSLPKMPRHITLITSPNGAAVHDFIKIASRRFPLTRINVFPVSVQGEKAAEEIISAISEVNLEGQTDIIVVCRGGGSSEDLHVFNDEQLARAIFASEIPIVSAIGHEIDFTIADFVSDVRAPTPSGAAELILPDIKEMVNLVKQLRFRLTRQMDRHLEQLGEKLKLQRHKLVAFSFETDNLILQLDHLATRMHKSMEQIVNKNKNKIAELQLRLERQNPSLKLRHLQENIATSKQRLCSLMEQRLKETKNSLEQQRTKLISISPQATLARGYAIVQKEDNSLVVSANQLKPGETARITLKHGGFKAKTEEIFMDKTKNNEAETK